jgi:small subunit ribosomal protein S6
MSLYESVIILKQDIASTTIDRLIEDWQKILENCGAKTVKQEYLGCRPLAYKINNNSKGHYVLLCIDGPFSAIKEYRRKIKLSEYVVRSENMKVKKFTDTPLLRNKTSAEPEINVTEQNR